MSLARLLTGVLVVTLFVDGISRPFPIDWLAFRPWEAAMRDRPPEAAFEPDLTIRVPALLQRPGEHGEQAWLSRLQAGDFHDRFVGFRNDPDVVQQRRRPDDPCRRLVLRWRSPLQMPTR